MFIYSPLWVRVNECPSGSLYYTCASSGFAGCCTVDACYDATGGCPDDTSSSSSSSTSTTTRTSTRTSTLTSTTSSTTSSTSSTASATSATTTEAVGEPISTTEAVGEPVSTTEAVGEPVSTTRDPATVTKTVQISSTPSSTSESSSIAPATSSAVPTATNAAANADGNLTSSSGGLSKGAVGGIVVSGVLVFVAIAAFLCWKFWRRRKDLKEAQDRQLAAGREESRIGGAGEKHHSQGLLSSSPNQARSPGGDNESLFGEATSGGIEAALARWGLHGARLAALRKGGTTGSVRSRHNMSDLGGSYMGQGGKDDKDANPAAAGLLYANESEPAELDGNPTIVAELESPDPTVKNSPSNSSQSAPTFVSSWRNSGRTISTAMASSPTITELDSTPRMSSSNSPGGYRPVSGASSTTPGIPEADSETDAPGPLKVPGNSSWRYAKGHSKSSSSNNMESEKTEKTDESGKENENNDDDSKSDKLDSEKAPQPSAPRPNESQPDAPQPSSPQPNESQPSAP